MNFMKFLPERLKENYRKNLMNSAKSPKYVTKMLFAGLVLSIIVALAVWFFRRPSFYLVIGSFFGAFLLTQIFAYFNTSLKASKRIGRMEKVFPDFIGLMSSNLRAGMTVEKAFLNSARPELAPLDKEIKKTGKEIATGKSMSQAFKGMADRIDSDKIEKVVSLIISGLRTGGNISTLLQTTASNMRERAYLEKRASSNVLMYVIFIFVAVGVGAPILFGLSSVLVEVIIELTGQLPNIKTSKISMPFTMSGVSISSSFIIYFSIGFILITDIISSLLLGLVNKGNEKYGLKYVFPLIAISLGLFFAVRLILSEFLVSSFSIIS